MDNNDNLIEAYIGKKYEKIMKCKFSVFSFFLGTAHWAYRKMILESIVYLLILIVIVNLIPAISGIVILISMLLQAFLFTPVYKFHVNKKVEKIVKNNQCSDYELERICEKKGGTSVIFAILFEILYIIIVIFLIIAFVFGSFLGFIGLIPNLLATIGVDLSNNHSVDQLYEESSVYVCAGIEYLRRGDIDISQYVTLDIPENFSKGDSFEEEAWEYEAGDYPGGEYAKFSIELLSKDYNSSEEFISEQAKILKEHQQEVFYDIYTLKINDNLWNVASRVFDNKVIYYNTIKCDENKVLLFEYGIFSICDVDNFDYYNQIYSDIMNSIQIKTKTKENIKDDNIEKDVKIIDKEALMDINPEVFKENEGLKISDNYEIQIDDSEDILSLINVDLPEVFTTEEIVDESEDYSLNLFKEKDEDLNNGYGMSILVVKDETESEEVINRIAKEYDVEDEAYSVELDNGIWNIVAIQSDEVIDYYNATTIDDKVVLFHCEYGTDIEDEDILNSYNEIIFSIRAIENYEEDSED